MSVIFFCRDFINPWNFRPTSNFFPDLRVSASEIEEVTERDREPLSPNYQDPIANPSDEKPIIQLKPVSTSTTTTPKPASGFPGGIIDVDASGGFGGFPSGGGFAGPSFPEISPDFGLGFRPGGLLGFGGLFGTGGQMKPWWKGYEQFFQVYYYNNYVLLIFPIRIRISTKSLFSQQQK